MGLELFCTSVPSASAIYSKRHGPSNFIQLPHGGDFTGNWYKEGMGEQPLRRFPAVLDMCCDLAVSTNPHWPSFSSVYKALAETPHIANVSFSLHDPEGDDISSTDGVLSEGLPLGAWSHVLWMKPWSTCWELLWRHCTVLQGVSCFLYFLYDCAAACALSMGRMHLQSLMRSRHLKQQPKKPIKTRSHNEVARGNTAKSTSNNCMVRRWWCQTGWIAHVSNKGDKCCKEATYLPPMKNLDLYFCLWT